MQRLYHHSYYLSSSYMGAKRQSKYGELHNSYTKTLRKTYFLVSNSKTHIFMKKKNQQCLKYHFHNKKEVILCAQLLDCVSMEVNRIVKDNSKIVIFFSELSQSIFQNVL